MAYRYVLTREFERNLFDTGPEIDGLFIGLNPSTADERDDDATVRRWTGFAQSWHWRRYFVANLYAWRSTDPAGLVAAADPVGPDNDRTIAELVVKVNGPVICCWGNNGGPERKAHVLELLKEHGVTPYALRVTRAGQPEHVLRLPKNLYPKPLSELLAEAPWH
jgi:hypothetical protein